MLQKNKASVIICTCNRFKDITTCLSSLANQTELPQEIIIIDSSDQPIEQHSSFQTIFNEATFKNTKLVYRHTAKGLTFQRNVGISCANGDIIYFFDDDVILNKDYLAQMNSAFALHPSYVGGMGSVINIPKKRNDAFRFLRATFLLQRIYASGKFTLSGQPTHSYGKKEFCKVEALGGCCMAYRSHVFKKHLFDEKLPTYGYMEDCDFSYRASRDAPLFYNPSAKMLHMESPLDRDKIVENRAMFMRHYIYLFFKNMYPKNKLRIIPFAWSVFGLFFEALLFRQFNRIRGYIKGIRTPIK